MSGSRSKLQRTNSVLGRAHGYNDALVGLHQVFVEVVKVAVAVLHLHV